LALYTGISESYAPGLVGVSAAVEAGEPIVQPGGTSQREVRVRNTGQVVDNIVIDLVGDAASWSKVEPSELNLFPGDEQRATVTFAPPRSALVLAGRVPFAVRVLSKEDTAGSVVREGEIEVAPFTELVAELVPKTVRVKRRGTTEVAIDNLGNVPLNAQLAFEDLEDQMVGAVTPQALTLAPGRATFAKVAIKPRRTFLRGAPKTLPFRVVVVPDEGSAPVYADGAVLQEALLPKWLLKAVLALLALLLLLVVLWNTLLKSSIESAAREAAVEETAAATEAAKDAASDAAKASTAAEDASASAAKAAGSGTEDPADPATGSGNKTGVLALGDQIDFRIRSNAAPGAGFVRTAATAQPEDKVLLVTDIVFQNPTGDLGVIQVLRGDAVLLEVGLANFRDLDYHFVAPIRFSQGQALRLAVNCANAAPTLRNCTSSAYFAGVAADPGPGV
jgi:hypothetical protein